ncbi:Ku protein [Streptomyces sp. ICBB 8177]|uniref:non-homologous end joining protein Ku n=1 Tax=Streptomyces sp. ICBB 8177 TaxID=563922 RepID=UPI000D6789E3|nr:Ku protein [Streptomyces sp. ICBB 8177]PWI45071.1 Ku protein [Streptomyces sp. ICBB 8177]
MPHPQWKGQIGFGLVQIGVELTRATGSHDLRAHQVHRQDGGRVRQRRYCEVCGREVSRDDIARGYEQGDQQAVLTEEDMAGLPLPSKRLIDVLAVIPADAIDPLQYDTAYWVTPQTEAQAKPYELFRDTLAETGQVAVTKVAIATREAAALLRVHDESLILQTLLWPDEVRSPDFHLPGPDAEPRAQERRMMMSLMDRLSQDFRLEEETDRYQEALKAAVTAKLEGEPLPHDEGDEEPTGGDVIGLATALQASLDATRGKPAGRKTTAKKTSAKKATAKKAKAPSKKAAAARRKTG